MDVRVFPHVWMWEFDHKEGWGLKNWWFWTVVLEKTWESLGLQGDQASQFSLKEISLNIHWKDWCWSWSSNTLATWCEELTHWKRPWCWERLKAGGEGHNRGWDGWMASLTQWAWVWASSGSWWWTGKPGVLQSMGLKESDTTDRLNWTDVCLLLLSCFFGYFFYSNTIVKFLTVCFQTTLFLNKYMYL